MFGWFIKLDGNRNFDFLLEGEIYVIQEVLKCVGFLLEEIDYINFYGIGFYIGDEIELKVLYVCWFFYVYINVIKLIIGYGFSVVGIVEIIFVLL